MTTHPQPNGFTAIYGTATRGQWLHTVGTCMHCVVTAQTPHPQHAELKI